MSNAKQMINELVLGIKEGNIELQEAWERIKQLRGLYVQQNSQQSWNTFIGNKFQEAILFSLKVYFSRLKTKDSQFKNLDIFTEPQVKGNPIIKRKLARIRRISLTSRHRHGDSSL